MFEPRGSNIMSGSLITTPVTPGADIGVIYIEVSGFLPMCGHGTIAAVTVLVETGMVPVTEPVTDLDPGYTRRSGPRQGESGRWGCQRCNPSEYPFLPI